MNSYFQAINVATGNGRFPELGDCWRAYHPGAIMSDSDYQYLTDMFDADVIDEVCNG